MKNEVSATMEKRARIMFEGSRRGAQNFIQWYSLTEDQRDEWRDQAIAIEASIAEKLKEQAED
jgi:hypothetical protein